jgi:hypothetical protein
MVKQFGWLVILTFVLSLGAVRAEEREVPYRDLKPFTGKHHKGVDTQTLRGKVMCGYQGWFAAPGDGAGRGWVHYNGPKGVFKPGFCTIDIWPDMSEMEKDEKYPTPFKHKDGSTAHVFSPYNPKTVMRHFAWMEEAGIDGVFLQRFGSSVRGGKGLNHRNVVTSNVQAGANRYGRTWAMMYDLSGLRKGEIESVVIRDWKQLIDRGRITSDKSYLHHNGKPVVALWGIGFGDNRKYTLEECHKLVTFLKDDKRYGSNTVMLGVPFYWRTLARDSTKNPLLHTIIKKADIVSPWSVGRYSSPKDVTRHVKNTVKPDVQWTKENNLDYLPVIFPGFSWQNLRKTQGINKPLAEIPRRKGQFLWSQATGWKKAGAEMLYVAMFDEVDEATAIFKCSNDPPVGESRFLTYDGLPTDHYLWLVGQAGKILRSKASATEKMPTRNTQQGAEGDTVNRAP